MQHSDLELYYTNRMLKTLISNLPGMVCRFKNNLDWTMEYMSEGCLELTGYSPDELIGNRTISYGQITLAEDNLHVWEQIQKAIKSRGKYQVEYRIKTKNGDTKWVWEQGAAIYDESDSETAIEAFMTDISHQKKVECDLQKSIMELNEKNIELDAFNYKISHDIRSPLLTIYGLTSLLRMAQDPGEANLYCDKIDATVKRLDNFTKDLLAISRSKEYVQKLELIDFESLIHEVLVESGYPNYRDLVNFETEIHLNKQVVSEIFRLKIILGNLLSNALKYRDTKKPESFLKVKITNDDTHCVIDIHDNGIGIAPEYQEEVFKMFVRVTDVSEGTGLGLYIVKMNVDKLGGTISCTGEVGLGTQFLLTIPLENL
jgi:PAS domain S-box-containing protein